MGEVKKANVPAPATSRQYDLFSKFFGDPKSLSNTMELWDAIPKYAVSARNQSANRDKHGHLASFEQDYQYKAAHTPDTIKCAIEMQPARIKEKDGSFKEYLPSQSEELIEEVLKKIFTDQRYGLHNVQELESWVVFSLHMIRKELKNRGHTRSIQEIKKSLEIMSKVNITVKMRGRGRGQIYDGNILSDMIRQTREDLADDPNAKWAARLPVLISRSVNELSYRQYNYARHMELPNSLTRWLHTRFVHRYRNASLVSDYNFLLSSIQRDSCMLQYKRNSANIKALDEALEELKQQGVLFRILKEEQKPAKTIIDVKYRVWASSEFRDEVKAAHARHKKNDDILQRKIGGR